VQTEWSQLEIGEIGWAQWEAVGSQSTLMDLPSDGWIWLEVIERGLSGLEVDGWWLFMCGWLWGCSVKVGSCTPPY
jgi:hypothetical protein